MFSRLSIFSFDTLTAFPKPTRAFGLMIALLVIVSLMMSSCRESLEQVSPRSQLTPILSYLDSIETDQNPRIVFLGSSRFVSCIKTDLISKALGLSPSAVINLSVDSGSFWESLYIVRKYPSLLDSVSLAVIDIEPWMFNKNLVHPIYKKPHAFEPHFYSWATFAERLEVPTLKDRALLLVDFFWPTYERRKLYEWYEVGNKILRNSPPEAHLAVPLYHYDRKAFNFLANDPAFSAHTMASRYHLFNYEFSDLRAEYLRRLVQLLSENSINVVLLQPPVREEYMDVIYTDKDYQNTYSKVLTFVRELENDFVRSIIWETPGSAGLDESVFVDYGHFNFKGAQRFTELLVPELMK